MKKLVILTLAASLLLAAPLGVLAIEVAAEFNPGLIVPDSVFADTQTFGGPEGIQQFLESKNSVLANTDISFLPRLSEPSDGALKAALGDPNPNMGRLRTAAELIWDAARASGLNPQVILVTLNKEQGLITSQFGGDRLQKALNRATGFDCPDSSGCGNLFPGFYYQLFGNVDTSGNRYLGATKSLMKSFLTPGGRGPTVGAAAAKVGETIILPNTLGDYEGIAARQIVALGNAATAALYRYTPHVFNGNYNFWKFFTAWFKYPNGTLLKSLQSNVVYILQNGQRQQVPAFVAAVRNLNLNAAVIASPTELESYPLGSVYGPDDNTVVVADQVKYVFLNNIMHPVSPLVLKQRKLDAAPTLPLAVSEAALFTAGSQLTPVDGTILRGTTLNDTFQVEKGVLKRFSTLTLAQHKIGKSAITIPDFEIGLYPKSGYIPPLSGTLIKGTQSNTVYVVNDGLRRPLTLELFYNLRYKFKDVVTLTDEAELAALPLASPATPREGTYFSVGGSSELYVFKEGTRHPIFPFVAKQRGMTPDYAFEASIVSGWMEGIAIPPRDGTVLKSDAAPTLYLVAQGQLKELTPEVMKNLGLSMKSVVTLPDNQVSAFAKNGFAPPKENTYFAVAGTDEFYRFQNSTKRRIYSLTAKTRGMTPDFTFSAEAVRSWPDGLPIVPRNGTLIQSNAGQTIYLVSSNKLQVISGATFKRYGYQTKNIRLVPQTELEDYLRITLAVK
ncbi:MAG: hypothetical protein V1821_00385 [bacterium]